MTGLKSAEENTKSKKDLGYPPLVTPMSQMVGSGGYECSFGRNV